MSTKTTFKRVALVAVAALGFGMLSVVPSNAALPTYNVFYPSQSGLSSTSTTAGWVIPTVASSGGFVTLTAASGASALVAGASSLQLTVTGGTILSATAASKTWTCTGASLSYYTGTASGSTMSTTGAIVTGSKLEALDITLDATTTNPLCTGGFANTGNGTAAANFKIATSAAGTITAVLSANVVDPTTGQSSSTALESFVIVVAAAASTSYGKTIVGVTFGVATFDGAGTAYTPKTAGTKALGFFAQQVTNLNGPVATASSKEVIATITGVGSFSSSVFSSLIVAPAGTWDNSNTTEDLAVYADGRAGTGTLTVKVGGVTVATQDFVFYGSKVASITAVGIYKIARSGGKLSGSLNGDAIGVTDCNANGLPVLAAPIIGTGNFACVGSANQPAIALVAKDADGMVIPVSPAAITMTSSDQTVIQSGITDAFIDNGQSLYSAGWGYIHTTQTSAVGSTSGKSASLTYSYLNTDGTIITSNAVVLTLGGSVAKEVMTLDSSQYQPGAPFAITWMATDSAGNPVYDGAATPSDVSATRATQGALLSTIGSVYVGGKYATKTDKFFVPATIGTFTIKATSGNLAGDTLTAVGQVVLDSAVQDLLNASADAAAEATDAANAATDAANAAAEAADAATAAAQDASDAVAALSAQVAILIAGLKAQLTALTNLIIKIQKKLKA